MSVEDSVRMLGAGVRSADPAEWKRMEARAAWVRETIAGWRAAMHAMNDRCGEAVEWMDEEAFERLFDEEEAKVAAIRAPLTAAAERDEWPKGLYFGGI